MTCQENCLAGVLAHRQEYDRLFVAQVHLPNTRTPHAGELSLLHGARALWSISEACSDALEGIMGLLEGGIGNTQLQRELGVMQSAGFNNR
jgi:hypothetical protein